MQQNWMSRFSDNIRDYDGYAIGKLFKLLSDPETISLAGGLPSPDTFLKADLQRVSQKRLQENADTIMQYTDITGEMDLIESVIQFLKADNINISKENIVITSSGQQGLDLTGRLFLNPGDAVILDRPTFAGAIVAFQMQRPVFGGVEIEEHVRGSPRIFADEVEGDVLFAEQQPDLATERAERELMELPHDVVAHAAIRGANPWG